MTRIRVLRTLLAVLFSFGFAALPARAELCPACKELSHTKDLGSCTLCGRTTMSGSFQLCMADSERLQECERCRQPLPPAASIREDEDGKYTHGLWAYTFEIRGKGSRSEGWYGTLTYASQPVPAPAVNDYVRTPWGILYWVGDPKVLFGGHGWMPQPSNSLPGGRLVAPPDPRPSGN